LFALANAASQPNPVLTYTGAYMNTVVALLAFGTILCSLVSLAFKIVEKYCCFSTILFLISSLLMSLCFVIIITTAEEVGADNLPEIYFFLLIWIGYPAVYLLQFAQKSVKFPLDSFFCILDVLSKAVFGIWTVQKSFPP
jgi:bacteriorhodopsin